MRQAEMARAEHGAYAARRRGRRWPRRKRRGLIGVLLTVIVLAIAAGIALAIFGRSAASLDTQVVQTAVTTLEGEIRRSFASAREYSAEDYQDFLAPRMPENVRRGAAGSEEIRTPWGGEITASGGGTGAGTFGTAAASPNRFWIYIEDLPRSACLTIAESFLERSTVVSVHVGDTLANARTNAVANRADINTQCSDPDGVGILFRG